MTRVAGRVLKPHGGLHAFDQSTYTGRMRQANWVFAFLLAAVVALAGCKSSGNSCGCGDDYVVNADIWGAPEGDLFIAGYRGMTTGFVKRFENGTWTTIYEGGHSLTSLWGTSSEDFFVLDVAYPVVQHYSHGAWQSWYLGGSLDGGPGIREAWALWGTADDDLFVAGSDGVILHFDGISWQSMSTPTTARLSGLWGSAHDNIIAVGQQGTILHFDGTAWSIVPSPTTASLNAVWGASADNVFIVGEIELEISHVILHFDGVTASIMHQGEKGLLGINGTGPDRVYAVGAKRNGDGVSGGVFRFDGIRWTEVSVGVSQFLWDVWVNPDGSYIAVGPDDTIINRSGK